MAQRKITIADTFEPIEVDLFGLIYKTVPITRSVQHAAVELEKEAGDILNDATANPDDQVAYLAKAIALRLKAVEDDAPSAAEQIVTLYKDDKLCIDQIIGLIEDLSGEDNNPL
jgi:hypothetical protein